ncbi:MAG: polysaccharide deacetylase family protein [Wolbachia sp.]
MKCINKKTSEIVKRIYNAGHELGNHFLVGGPHRKLTSLSSEEQLQELEKTSIAIKNAMNQNVKWFRPQYGYYDDNLIKNANRLNMYSILWTVDSLDW